MSKSLYANINIIIFYNMFRNLLLFFVAVLFICGVGVSDVYATQLVPVECDSVQNCGTCEFLVMVNNVVKFVVVLSALLATITLIVAGFTLVTSGGNVAARQTVKTYLANIFVGFIILLTAWLIIDLIIKSLLPGDSPGLTWYELECVYPSQPVSRSVDRLPSGGGPGGFGSTPDPAIGSCDPRNLQVGDACYAIGRCSNSISDNNINFSCSRVAQYASAINAASNKYGVPASRIRAIIIVESSGLPGAVSGAGARGLMQVLPSTANQHCGGMSASDLMDPAKNIDCGTSYYKWLMDQFNNNDLAAAGYNGGPGANGNSNDCPGLRRWQCPFDSGGCCVGGQVTQLGCQFNTGYNETRQYVDKINRAQQACG